MAKVSPLGPGFRLGPLNLTKGGGGYTPANSEAAALFARFTTPPTNARKALIDALVGSLKTAGVWAKLDALYLFAAADAQAARQNWVQDLYNATAVSSPTFTSDRGYTGDGAASYVDSNFNPSTAVAAKFVRDSAYFGFWSRTAGQLSASAAGYFDGTNGVTRLARNLSNESSGRINQATPIGTSGGLVTDGSGLLGISRSGASANRLSRNGANQFVGTVASSALANGTLRFGATGIGFSTLQFAAGLIGQDLSVSDELAAYTPILTYLQAVGAA